MNRIILCYKDDCLREGIALLLCLHILLIINQKYNANVLTKITDC